MTHGGESIGPQREPPRILAEHYRLERELGRGGMATVFLCTDLRDNREVAFKVLKPELGNTVTRERFLREVTFISELDHPAIPKVIETGVVGEDPFYVMTYVKGESLRSKLDREKQLPISEAIRIGLDILKPMAYAHDRSIVHRDVKPDNILLSDGSVFVLDFGIARAIAASSGDRLTRTGMAVGTPAYMSPEQAMGDRELDWRSDIYSLGCVVYEMIAGVPPFSGASPQILMFRRFSAPARALRNIRAEVSEALESAVAKAMAKAPEDRWQTAKAFADALASSLPAAREPEISADSAAESVSTSGASAPHVRNDGLLEKLRASFAGTYAVDEEMKGGGMSRLFLATDPELNRRVVIKILPPELTSQMMLARFRRESEVTARLQHPHILPVISAGVRDGLAHYVMPFCDGESLRGRLEREGRMPIDEGVRVLREVTAALSYAHKQGVVHLNIKPENILIQDGHAVLADFRTAAAQSGAGNEAGERLTGTGTSPGTVGYMAPEQALSARDVDARADIYAVGVVGYEIFAGSPPFTGTNEQAVLVANLTRDAVFLDEVRVDLPPLVSAAIGKAMQKDPAARFQTAGEFHDALEGSVGATSAATAAFRFRTLRNLPRRWKIGVPAAIVIAVASTFAIRYEPSAGPAESITIVVAPFSALGTGLELWREGMVDIMARNLDGAGPLHTVSPDLSVKGFTSAATRESATALARRTRADYAIFGTVVGSSADSVRLRATLVNATTDAAWDYEIRDATVEGLADRFTVAVLAQLDKTHRIGAVRQSSLGSASVPALRAFLQGEQFFRRGSWDSASAAYGRAIGFDRNFAEALGRAAQVARLAKKPQ